MEQPASGVVRYVKTRTGLWLSSVHERHAYREIPTSIFFFLSCKHLLDSTTNQQYNKMTTDDGDNHRLIDWYYTPSQSRRLSRRSKSSNHKWKSNWLFRLHVILRLKRIRKNTAEWTGMEKMRKGEFLAMREEWKLYYHTPGSRSNFREVRGIVRARARTHTHTHTPVSYTHLTLPTRRTV